MDQELYRMIRPVRGRDIEEIESRRFFRFADIHPKSFSSMIVGGWVSLMISIALYCLYLY